MPHRRVIFRSLSPLLQGTCGKHEPKKPRLCSAWQRSEMNGHIVTEWWKRARTSISQLVWVEASNQKSNSNLMAGNVIQTHAVNGARNETISWCRCESRSMCWTETRSCIERHAKLWNPRRNTCWRYTNLISLKISNFEVQWQTEAFQFKAGGSSNENGGLPSGIATNQSLGNNKTRWAQHSLKVKAPW